MRVFKRKKLTKQGLPDKIIIEGQKGGCYERKNQL